jgi:D-alanyl-D-alanine dipeptidase
LRLEITSQLAVRYLRPALIAGIIVSGLHAEASVSGDIAHPGARPLPKGLKPAFPPDQDVDLPGLVDVKAKIPEIAIDLKYGTSDNFMGADVYGGLKRCFLVPEAVDMLAAAHKILKERDPDLTFVMYDCARPVRVQKVMWEVVKGTPSQNYVANPHTRTGSIHNYGCAIDMSLYDTKAGKDVDMGTPYDFFGRKAEPRHELKLWKKGQLTSAQLANRYLLREVMLRAGFLVIPNEWWHFNCTDNKSARTKYPKIP